MERRKRPYSLNRRPTTKKNRFVYYCRFRDPETQAYRSAISTGCSHRDDAILWAEGKLKEANDKAENTTLSKYSTGFWNLQGAYAQKKLVRGYTLSNGYLEIAEANTRKHLLPVWGAFRLREINAREIDEWIVRMRKESGLASATINKLLQTIRTILDSALSEGLIADNPAKYVKPLRTQARERGTLTSEEVARLLSPSVWNDSRHYAITLIALTTGARLGEIQALQIGAVHSDCIEIRHSWEQGHGLKEPKWGSARCIPISRQVFDAVDDIIRKTRPATIIFYGDSLDAPIGRSWIEKRLYEALAKIGIDERTRRERNLTFHSHRHTLNTILRSRGVPDSKVQRITGHRSTAMSNHYTHYRVSDFTEVVTLQDSLLPWRPIPPIHSDSSVFGTSKQVPSDPTAAEANL
jgi:integrase